MHEFFISFFFFFAVLFYNTFLSYISVYQNLSSVTYLSIVSPPLIKSIVSRSRFPRFPRGA